MNATRTVSGPTGVLIVDKPQGPTSFDIVAQARRHLGTRRVGHCGTLDPMASGVLVVVVGEATKLSGALTGADKSYRATIRFGYNTDTLDAEGEVTEERALTPGWATAARLTEAASAEHQRELQVPPAHSAIRLEGKRAYALARQGATVELAPRPVQVKKLELLRFDDESAELFLSVSKGYYVRSLARDFCDRLGVCGHLSKLRRTASGCFELADAEPWPPVGTPRLMSMADAVQRALPCASLTEVGVQMARHGKALAEEHFSGAPCETLGGWLSAENELVALGERRDDGYRVVRGFAH